MEQYNYDKTISILTSQAKFHISLGLDRISRLLELLGNPQDELKVVHVAGTNGKGSTCAMLSSILTHAGYKTGLFTSPHLIEYTERMKINGQDISKEDFSDILFKVLKIAERNNIPVTEFEILTAMGFLYFKEQNTNVVILETGLGGRLDATNVIKNPLVSVITTIDIDHTDRLGDTIEKIAFEKAGIIKERKTAVTIKDNQGVDVIREVAKSKNSTLELADDSGFTVGINGEISTKEKTYKLPLLGLWQKKNLAIALKTVEMLSKQFDIPQTAIAKGLKNVFWPGRMQYIKDKRAVLDGAHNPSGAIALRESLDFYFPLKKRVWIYSSISTKDFNSIMTTLFNTKDIVILTKPNSPSAVDPELLKQKILNYGLTRRIYVHHDVKKAVNFGLSNLTADSILIVAGSLYTIGNVIQLVSMLPEVKK